MDEQAQNRLRLLYKTYSHIFSAFEAEGHSLYLVGGCVRDVLMSVTLSKETMPTDIDFATDARPDKITEILKKNRWRTYPIGERFGTIAALIRGQQIEITTFRAHEHYEPGNRKPEVVFGDTIEADLHRRDLTINAMAAGKDGALIDPFGGAQAIKDQVLEVPGGDPDNTIAVLSEDPLRILRVARFASRLGFKPSAIVTQAAKETHRSLRSISRERWKMELDKLLMGKSAADALAWLADTESLSVVLPWIAYANHAQTILEHGAILEAAPTALALRWALLLLPTLYAEDAPSTEPERPSEAPSAHDIWAPVISVAATPLADRPEQLAERHRVLTRQLAQGMRMSREEAAQLATLLAMPLGIALLDHGWERGTLCRISVELGENFHLCAQLLDALLSVAAELNIEPQKQDKRRATLAQMRDARDLIHSDGDPTPQLPKGLGDALHLRCSIERGPLLGEALGQVREAIYRGDLDTSPDIDEVIAWWKQVH